ncbi:hypothetical protein ACHAPE_000749 [Trichoderma viride]
MTAMRGPRLQVGSAAWIGEERASALEIVQSEVEEFNYSAHNEIEWLNEHMAAILNENEVNITEAFKTPGKLRGKTPHTARKPLSDVFAAATPAIPKNQNPSQTKRIHPAPQLHQVASKTVPISKAASPQRHVFSPQRPPPTRGMQDSGYYGSQDFAATDPSDDAEPEEPEEPEELDEPEDIASPYSDIVLPPGGSSIRRSPARKPVSILPTKSFQTTREDLPARALPNVPFKAAQDELESSSKESDVDNPYFEAPVTSPRKLPMPPKQSDETSEDDHSASEGSSPIRPVVRKSSLNFASLPAREPLNSGKSLGARQSRNSHFDAGHNSRTSYYQRQTGGKSLGNLAKRDLDEEENPGGTEVDGKDLPPLPDASEVEKSGMNHTKTYTQRLQDQISMLGKPQGSFGQTKQTPNTSVAQQSATQMQSVASPKQTSPEKEPISTTPRASPEDDDDDWIGPPTAVKDNTDIRPLLAKSHTADIMEGLLDKAGDDSLQANEPTPHGFFHHSKTMSFSNAPTASAALMRETVPLSKAISTSSFVASQDDMAETPSKSLPRNFRDSPLKQVKNKLSSILKGSRGLLASNAEGKSLTSPSVTRLALHAGQSSESLFMRPQDFESQPTDPASPTKPIARRTRASTEREKEQKRRDNELKRMEEQMDKLDKAREKEREKARAFTQEQEKVATMEKETASRKQDERVAIKATPNSVKRSQSSPRKMRAGEEPEWRQADRDTDMSDAQPSMPPPSSTKPTLSGQPARGKDNKRPVKPTKDLTAKTKAPPTVIRVNTGSQHSQYAPAGSRVSTASHDTLNSNHSTASSKTSKSSYQAKSATQTFKAPASAGRSKAAELAARKREQDEKESQRRRDAKAEMERKRIAAQEEQRKQDQQRRLELERQRQQDEEKKSVQRQAAIEKAKQTRAPPPAPRSQPNGPPDTTLGQQKSASSKAEGQPARPPSRLAGMRDDSSRPFNSMLSKAGAKRTLGAETSDNNNYSRPPPSRGGPAYQTKDSKRRRTSEHEDDELGSGNPPNIKGPPVRPSTGFKKDLPSKSAFQNGYGAAPQSATRDLFKAAVTAQHNSHMKAAHPLDMAQISKGPIPFAPSSNAAAGSSFKTPARPGQLVNPKSSVKRPSPRPQTGDSIELPEIQTDDEDDDDEPHGMNVAAWADSPDLRQALMRQETMDPSQIFGPPAPLIMEEVFSKSKDKWHKFRQRTSSANWSGLDRLTEDDIRKDMVARNKLRRDGGWSYEMSKDML